MIVKQRNPSRETTVAGPLLVSVLLDRLDLNRESVLVIRNGSIIPNDTRLEDSDVIEIRPVISGGAFEPLEDSKQDVKAPGSLVDQTVAAQIAATQTASTLQLRDRQPRVSQ